MTRRLVPWLRPAAAVLVLGALLWRFGADPVVRGVRDADARLLLLAVALTALATACCAWRWRAVSTALGVPLRFGPAYAACYGAQLLNATLPAGVLGDVHRAVDHARGSEGPGRAVRSVVEERTLGLAVQAGLTVAVVALVPSGLRPVGVVAALVLLGLGTLVVLLLAGGRRLPGVRVAAGDLARLRRRPGTAWVVLVASLGVAGCHAAVLLAAMAAAGADISWPTRGAVALTVLLGSALPTSLAGWGPREGVAAWAYAAVGLPASDGLAASVTYGVAALVATLPGVLALVAGRLAPAPQREEARVG